MGELTFRAWLGTSLTFTWVTVRLAHAPHSVPRGGAAMKMLRRTVRKSGTAIAGPTGPSTPSLLGSGSGLLAT